LFREIFFIQEMHENERENDTLKGVIWRETPFKYNK
jgi:hypothetical protein